MSYVYLLSSDKPLPLADCRTHRAITFPVRTNRLITSPFVQMEGMFGFSLVPASYSPYELRRFDCKPYLYEMPDLTCDEQSLSDLRFFLERRFSHGDAVQLLHADLGADPHQRPPRYCGPIAALDMESFSQLFEEECSLTVFI